MTTSTHEVRAETNDTMQALLTEVQQRLGTQKFNAWFRHGTRLSADDGCIRLAVANPFVARWVESHYQGLILDAAEQVNKKRYRLIVSVEPELSGDLRKRQLDSQADIVHRTGQGRVRPSAKPQGPKLRHSLSDFVVGEGNKLAYSASQAVAGSGKAPFNPLFIHGNCGVGKTHLLQGICRAVSKRRTANGPLAWRYVTAEQFTNDFIQSLRRKKLHEFRARYRRLHLLAIDDVHFLSAKKATQDEFLHTFNELETAGAQIVMASDAHPKLVGELNEQLRSRFVAGMVVKVEPPDLPTRMEILRRRADVLKLDVPQDVREYVAMHVRGSVRELEGTLVKLAALAALENGKITLRLAGEALADHLARTDSALTVGDIETAVAAFFGITPADIRSSRRTRTVSTARMVAMLLARRHTRMSYPEIGRFMGKNHSSVVLAVQRLEKILAEDGELRWSSPAGMRNMPAAKVLEMLAEQFT